jgi:hypothetical protein
MTVAFEEKIQKSFNDPLLEFIRLLGEAAEIEHALAVQYLYMAFSVKNEFLLIKGMPRPIRPEMHSNSLGLFEIAVDEMFHLRRINRVLISIGAAPVMRLQDFPYEPEFYPFAFALEPLSYHRLLAFLVTEAPIDESGPVWIELKSQHLDRELSEAMMLARTQMSVNRLDVLYGVLLELTSSLDKRIGSDLCAETRRALKANLDEGECRHFGILARIWRNYYSSRALEGSCGKPVELSLALHAPNYPDIFSNAVEFGNKLYWLVCGLLQLGYQEQGDGNAFKARATDLMKGAVFPLGTALSTLGIGLRFSQLSMGAVWGNDRTQSIAYLSLLVAELLDTIQHLPTQLTELIDLADLRRKLRVAAKTLAPNASSIEVLDLFTCGTAFVLKDSFDTVTLNSSWREIAKLKMDDGREMTLKVAPSVPKDFPQKDIEAYRTLFRGLNGAEHDTGADNLLSSAAEIYESWQDSIRETLLHGKDFSYFKSKLSTAIKALQFPEPLEKAANWQQKLFDNCFTSTHETAHDTTLLRLFALFGSGTLAVFDEGGFQSHVHVMNSSRLGAEENFAMWHAINWAYQIHTNKDDLEGWQKIMPLALGVHHGTSPDATDTTEYEAYLKFNIYPDPARLVRFGCSPLPTELALEKWIYEIVGG